MHCRRTYALTGRGVHLLTSYAVASPPLAQPHDVLGSCGSTTAGRVGRTGGDVSETTAHGPSTCVRLPRPRSVTLTFSPTEGYVPSSVMIPQRRISTLLEQARAYQQSRCLYHNMGLKSRPYSLYTDHCCDRNAFPRVTTAVLKVHSDEVWNLEWSHSGRYLATASKDKSAIIWRVEVCLLAMQKPFGCVH